MTISNMHAFHYDSSDLGNVIQEAHLLARLEGRKAAVRAAIAAEGIAQRAAIARSRLALDGKVDFVEVVGLQLECLELAVGVGAVGEVFASDSGGKATRAVLAGSRSFTGLGAAFLGCSSDKILLADQNMQETSMEGWEIEMFHGVKEGKERRTDVEAGKIHIFFQCCLVNQVVVVIVV